MRMPVAWRTNKFLIWRFYRTVVVPICVVVALLSILFGGALVVEGPISQEQLTGDSAAAFLNQAVVINLLAASLLMLCHATYLALMANHLVYRFPIERPQWISLAYLAIVFGYVAHAWQTYLVATTRHGILE